MPKFQPPTMTTSPVHVDTSEKADPNLLTHGMYFWFYTLCTQGAPPATRVFQPCIYISPGPVQMCNLAIFWLLLPLLAPPLMLCSFHTLS